MYNRYIRNDSGVYERVPVPEPQNGPPPEEDRRDRSAGPPPRREPPPGTGAGSSPPPRGQGGDGRGALNSLLGRLKLENIDTGDLLLLAILFLLFREGGDEELLIALGLLLIL